MQNDKDKVTPTVKTYTDDMVRVVEESGGTVVRQVIEAEERVEEEKRNPEKQKNRIFGILGSVFTIAAVGILFYFSMNSAPEPLPLPEATPGEIEHLKISASTNLEVGGLTKEEVKWAILGASSAISLAPGEIGEIILLEGGEAVGLRHFVAIAGMNLPLSKIDFVEDDFLLGVINWKGTNHTFLLIKSRSFLDIFPALRDWEPKMLEDLSGLFGIGPALPARGFQDGIIKNKNARVLTDEGGQTMIMYVFVNDEFTLLMRSQEAVEEIIARIK